ncbi:MAG: AraC family transcriptional regulator [Planctomycetota bacterium]|nr:AraC family transcriptional regulator [Planctomycetota bacterium]
MAAANGFSSPELMCRCFQRVLGCSPSQWRARPASEEPGHPK